MGITDERGVPGPDFGKFITAHSQWLTKHRDFMAEVGTPEKAKAYVAAHRTTPTEAGSKTPASTTDAGPPTTPDPGSTPIAATSPEDERHQLYRAAFRCGDPELQKEVWRALGITVERGVPGTTHFSDFDKEHMQWLKKHRDFMQTVDTPEKAKAYLAAHRARLVELATARTKLVDAATGKDEIVAALTRLLPPKETLDVLDTFPNYAATADDLAALGQWGAIKSFSRDGRYASTQLGIVDLKTHKLDPTTFFGSFGSTGRYVMSAGANTDQPPAIFDRTTREGWMMNIDRCQPNTSLAWSRDDQFMLVVPDLGELPLLAVDCFNGTRYKLPMKNEHFKTAAISPHATRIAAASSGLVNAYDFPSCKLAASFKNAGDVVGVEWASDDMLVSQNTAGNLAVYDVPSGKKLYDLNAPDATGKPYLYMDASRQIALVHVGWKTLVAWDLKKGVELARVDMSQAAQAAGGVRGVSRGAFLVVHPAFHFALVNGNPDVVLELPEAVRRAASEPRDLPLVRKLEPSCGWVPLPLWSVNRVATDGKATLVTGTGPFAGTSAWKVEPSGAFSAAVLPHWTEIPTQQGRFTLEPAFEFAVPDGAGGAFLANRRTLARVAALPSGDQPPKLVDLAAIAVDEAATERGDSGEVLDVIPPRANGDPVVLVLGQGASTTFSLLDPATSKVTKSVLVDGHSNAAGAQSLGGLLWVTGGMTREARFLDPRTLENAQTITGLASYPETVAVLPNQTPVLFLHGDGGNTDVVVADKAGQRRTTVADMLPGVKDAFAVHWTATLSDNAILCGTERHSYVLDVLAGKGVECETFDRAWEIGGGLALVRPKWRAYCFRIVSSDSVGTRKQE